MDLTAGIKKLFGLPGETVVVDSPAETQDQATTVTETIRDGANLDRVAAALTSMSSMALEGSGVERWSTVAHKHEAERQKQTFIGRVITENRIHRARREGRVPKNPLRRAA